MKNCDITVTGNKLEIVIDLSKSFGSSSTGKSEMIASTEGNTTVVPGVSLGLNVYRKK